MDRGKWLLRDYVNATIGFPELGGLTRKPAEGPVVDCSVTAADGVIKWSSKVEEAHKQFA